MCDMDTCHLGCDKRVFGYGLCNMHYLRWRTHGDPLHEEVIMDDPRRRFWSKVDKTDTCWLWTGRLDALGYGTFTVGDRRYRAHRFAFFDGNVPLGNSGTIDIDHLCRVRHCVNPAHMEEVPHAENVRRGAGGEVARARMLARTHCHKGHPYEGDNLVYDQGKRRCRTCRLESQRARYQRGR